MQKCDADHGGGSLSSPLYRAGLRNFLPQSAIRNRFHTAEQRFCRWLLCTHDLVVSDTVELTQEIISDMLGVQRSVVSVTSAGNQEIYPRTLNLSLSRPTLGLASASMPLTSTTKLPKQQSFLSSITTEGDVILPLEV